MCKLKYKNCSLHCNTCPIQSFIMTNYAFKEFISELKSFNSKYNIHNSSYFYLCTNIPCKFLINWVVPPPPRFTYCNPNLNVTALEDKAYKTVIKVKWCHKSETLIQYKWHSSKKGKRYKECVWQREDHVRT